MAISVSSVQNTAGLKPFSVRDVSSVGVGPSSSHTVSPTRAAHQVAMALSDADGLPPTSILVELLGSLALTGIGHRIDTPGSPARRWNTRRLT
jgi:hypothetical protein